MHLEVLERSTPETESIRQALFQYNARLVGASGYRPLDVLLRAPEGHVIGGLCGSTYWNWLVIDTLWVHPSHRRRGHARRMMAEAEAQALARGSLRACIETYSFQEARPLYESLGYRVYATLPGFPPGHDRLFMSRDLQARQAR
jgi:GNAT superfamily N-acetyltransferase